MLGRSWLPLIALAMSGCQLQQTSPKEESTEGQLEEMPCVRFPGVWTKVTDESGNVIPNVTVMAISEGHTEALEQTPPVGDEIQASYSGVYEHPGTYRVLATAPGYLSQEQTVTVTRDSESNCDSLKGDDLEFVLETP